MRRLFSFFIRICISAGVLYYLLKQVDLNKIIQITSSANKSLLPFVLLLFFAIYFTAMMRWRILLVGLGFDLPLFLIFKSYCLGNFSNLFFPSVIGGDFLRSIDLGIRTKEPKRVAASVILDRISGYCGLVALALLALSMGHKVIADKVVFIALGAITIILTTILTVLFNNVLFSKAKRLLNVFGKIGQSLSNLHHVIYSFRSQKIVIIKSFIYSFIIQLSFAFLVYLIAVALGVRIGPIYFFILVPIISIITALPVSIAGLGLREASSVYFFAKVGVPAETAVAISFLIFLLMILIGLMGGIIYVLAFSHRRI